MKSEKENQYTGVIYCLTNKINGKQYVGQALSFIISHGKLKRHGLEGRFKQHSDSANKNKDNCPKLYNAIRKHGIDNFGEMILLVCPIELLNVMETYYIKNLIQLSTVIMLSMVIHLENQMIIENLGLKKLKRQ